MFQWNINRIQKEMLIFKCIWSDFDRAYSSICGNKMPTRCNRWSYCLLNMFQAPLCPSSGAREYYTDGCCLSYFVLGFQVVGMVWSWGLCVSLKIKALNTTGSNHLYNTFELLMMGIMVPETCWASNKICNKNHLLHLVGILFPHIEMHVYFIALRAAWHLNHCLYTGVLISP
jgi:hypothetical protein